MMFYSKALVFFGILSTRIHSLVKEYSVCLWFPNALGFPGTSVGKEFSCNAGDPSLIPGSGRSTGKGIGCPLQYSWVLRHFGQNQVFLKVDKGIIKVSSMMAVLVQLLALCYELLKKL